MNPRGIKRLITANDLQEAGRLNERRFAQSTNIEQLPPTAEWAVLLPMLIHAASGELIHSAHIPQERRAGAIELDADKAHTRLNDVIERVAQMLGPCIVL